MYFSSGEEMNAFLNHSGAYVCICCIVEIDEGTGLHQLKKRLIEKH